LPAFRLSTKYHDDETGLVYYCYRYYSPELGRWLNRDPLEERGGLNLYVFVNNDPVGGYDLLGLTSPDQILSSFFSKSTTERIWVMGEQDEYTKKVRGWQPVISAVDAAKQELARDSGGWDLNHRTHPSWQPGRTDPPLTDPNAWSHWVNSPPGTDPITAGIAYAIWRISGRITDDLWTASIGSFGEATGDGRPQGT
jgi:RHS repeat-associated protein